MRELSASELEEIKAKARDEGYQTGKSDAFKEAKMLVGTYGVKDIDSEETKIYIRAREEAVECLSKYEPHCGNWSWQSAYKEIQSLQTKVDELMLKYCPDEMKPVSGGDQSTDTGGGAS